MTPKQKKRARQAFLIVLHRLVWLALVVVLLRLVLINPIIDTIRGIVLIPVTVMPQQERHRVKIPELAEPLQATAHPTVR